MKQVTIKVSATGELSIEVSGVVGESCRDLTRKLREAGEVLSDDNTPDYYEQAENGTLCFAE